MKLNRIFLIFLIISLTSCGYQFQGSGSILPPHIKTVYIEDVENNTTETGLGRMMTEALKDRFDRYGTLQVVDKEYQADSVLVTEIKNVKRETRSVTSGTDTALQLETVMNLSSELKTSAGQILWTNSNLSINRSFGTAEDAVVTSSAAFAASGLSSSDLSSLDTREIARGQEKQVFEEMTEDVAKRIYESAVLPEF